MAKPGFPPRPIDHGSDNGYKAHLRRKERACDACRRAHVRAVKGLPYVEWPCAPGLGWPL